MKIKPVLQNILSGAENLTAIPAHISQIIKMTSSPDVNMNEVSRLISTEPALVSKLLKIVNSAHYGLKHEVSNLLQAINLLGQTSVKNIAVAISVFSIFPVEQSQIYYRLYNRALTAGLAADLISETIYGHKSGEYFLAGLLQNIGMLALLNHFREQYLNVFMEAEHIGLEIETIEDAQLGVNHLEAGELLAEQWHLPKAVSLAIRYKSDPARFNLQAENEEVVKLIKIASLAGLVGDIYYSWNRALKVAQFKADFRRLKKVDDHVPIDVLMSVPFLLADLGSVFRMRTSDLVSYERLLSLIDDELFERRAGFNLLYQEIQNLSQRNQQLEKEKMELKALVLRLSGKK